MVADCQQQRSAMRLRRVFTITGFGVHDQPESVFTIDWNLCSRSNGVRVHDPPESALHHPHQPLGTLAVHRPAVVPYHHRHPARAVKRVLQMEFVDPAHHRQIVRARRNRLIIQGRACDFQQTALRGDWHNRIVMVHQREPFGPVRGPDLLRKKSRSTVNWPIFSYKGAGKASSATPSPVVPA